MDRWPENRNRRARAPRGLAGATAPALRCACSTPAPTGRRCGPHLSCAVWLPAQMAM